MAQLTPEDRAQLDAFKAVIVKHAHLQEVDDQLSLWVEEHTDATHVLLCGPGGGGRVKSPERCGRTVHERGVRSLRGSDSLGLCQSHRIWDPTFGWITTGKSSMRSKSICWSKNWWGTWLTSWLRLKPPAQNWAQSIGSRCVEWQSKR